MPTYFIRNKTVNVAMLLFIALSMAGCGNSRQGNGKAVALKTAMENDQGADDMQLVCRGQAEPVRSFKYRLSSGQKIFRYLVREGEQVRSGQQLFESGSVDLMAQSDELNRMKIAIWDRRKKLTDLGWQSAELERALAATSMQKNQVDGSEQQDPDIARMVAAKKRELDSLQEEKKLLSAIAGADRLLGQSLEKLDGRIKEEISRLGFCSPFAGRVIYIPENAEQLLPGEMALEIWDESQIIIHIKVWQNQLRFIARGQVVEVQPDFFDGVLLKGTVLSVDSSPEKRANIGNPEYLVRISLQDGRGMIRPGMTVSVKIDLGKSEAPVSLP
jgi:multidrug efflux pump subunit AcrA (membrane-fusion protein)